MSNFAMLFPGQGSQYIGMLNDLYNRYSIIKETFLESSSILKYNLWKLIQIGSINELNKTWITQPVILTSSIAIWRLWKSKTDKLPKIISGHSLGEYTALVCSGVISFKEAIKLVEFRGKLMKNSIKNRKCAMHAIIGLNYKKIIDICKKYSNKNIVEPSSFNSLKQIVISGDKIAVENVSKESLKNGAKYVFPLSIDIPSHCKIMKNASNNLNRLLNKINFKNPSIPIVHNFNAKIEYFPKKIKELLVSQLYSPIQWLKCIEFIKSKNINLFIEVGPGNILSKLNKKIFKESKSISIDNNKNFIKALKL